MESKVPGTIQVICA